MSEEVSAGGEPFDLDKLKTLVELMEKHGLSEVSLRRGDEQWRLRRGPTSGDFYPSYGAMPAPPVHYPMAPPVQPPTPPTAHPKVEEAAAGTLVIKSPTVGTFYAAPTPDDPPFVTTGTRISPDTIVCIVEAMKVFNQIPAEVGGTIVGILVNNGDPVEFGQPLFRVRPD
jgi:acetyl-CoA carboxylase biotin carboxyl carrier protein